MLRRLIVSLVVLPMLWVASSTAPANASVKANERLSLWQYDAELRLRAIG